MRTAINLKGFHQLETYIKFEELFIEIISSENYE